jgi:signal transduction histidine kinase
MVSNILDHAKIGGSKFENNVSLKNLINNILGDFSERIKSSNAQIIIGSLPTINCYSVEIRLLFQNLLDNALKFVPDNRTPKINIDSEESNGFFLFKISDNGIGIPENELSNIFGAFQRISMQKDYEGSGLGLYGCKKIVEHHEGQIWVTSNLNRGTTFYIKLPVQYSELNNIPN